MVKVDAGSYTINPRGNLWYNDESTLGRKLLSKMGWSKGKGLGKNEDGIKENIKVRVKTNNAGVGWKDKLLADMQSTEYDALLKSLNENNSDSVKTCNDNEKKNGNISLVQLSRGFRNRLHYQKFIQGKDVSRYSEKDMKAIFSFNSKPDSLKSENQADEKQVKAEAENKELSTVGTYKSELSVSDYFAKKMKEKNGKLLNIASSDKPHIQPVLELNNREKRDLSPSNNAEEFQPKKKKKCSEEIIKVEDSSYGTDVVRDQSELKLCKKKRKRSYEESEEINSLKEATGENEIPCKLPNKKKKKKRNSKNQISSIELDNKLCYGKAICETNELRECSEKQNNISPFLDSTKNVQSSNDDKELKEKEKKISILSNLKSCLKKRKGKYDVKNVSFSECVSYRIINKDNSVYDSYLVAPGDEESSILDTQNKCDDVSEVALEEVDVIKTEVKNEEYNEVEAPLEESNGSASSDTPPFKSFHFDMWAECQRQALKMKIYKNMLKRIKKHDVLRTTNLLSIKGYGNWGF